MYVFRVNAGEESLRRLSDDIYVCVAKAVRAMARDPAWHRTNVWPTSDWSRTLERVKDPDKNSTVSIVPRTGNTDFFRVAFGLNLRGGSLEYYTANNDLPIL